MKNSCVWKYAACLFICLLLSLGNAWGATLFHETFGNNPNSAINWNDSASHKSGISSVYASANYTITNAKQSKNTNGSIQSGLQTITADKTPQTGTFIVGPLDVEDFTSLVVTYQWKAASVSETYWAKLYYKISSEGDYTEVSGTGNGATSFVLRTHNLSVDAQVSTLYLKLDWYTSNTNAVVDEFNLAGSGSYYSVYYDANNATSGSVPTDNNVYENGETVTVLDNTGSLSMVGHSFSGWNTESDGTGDSYVAGETFSIGTADVTLYAQWSNVYAGKFFNLVTDLEQLGDEKKIIILSKAKGHAISTTQNTNNRPAVAYDADVSAGFSVSGDVVTLASQTIVQVITLEATSTPNQYYFNVENGYLFASGSSGNNYLKTRPNNTSNPEQGQFLVSLDGSDNFTLQAQGDNDNTYLRYNSSSKLFSCYGSADSNNDILVYVLEETCSTNPTAGSASLNSAFKLTSTTDGIGVKTSGWDVGDECYWEDYGFVWGTTSTPTVSNNKVQVGTSGKASEWTGTLTPSGSTSPTSWSAGTTYYVRAYGKNGYGSGSYQYSTAYAFTPQSITYKEADGTPIATHYVPKDSVVAEENIYAPEKTGYTPSWCTDEDLTEDMNWSAAITDNIILYAKWVPIEYVVALDRESASSGSESVTVTYNSNTHTEITNPSRNGYTFGGYWTDDNGEGTLVIDAEGTLQENVDDYTGSDGVWIRTTATTLYAKWTAKTYTVNLNNQGATTAGTESVTATYGQAMPAITPPTKTGYRFNGYWTTAEGEGVQYYKADGSSAKSWARYADGEHTLYARWIPSYTITWRVGGQDYTTGDPTIETIEAEGITTMPTDPADNTLNCCNVFKGWSESELGGTGNPAPVDLFTTTDDAPTINENKTFYAVFATANEEIASEETTSSELTTNVTNTTCAYGTEKTWTDNSKIAYAFSVYTDAASRPWIQMNKANETAYIEITAPGNISRIDLTITAAENSSGGINDIDLHTKLPAGTTLNLNTRKTTGTSSRVAYAAGDGSSTSMSIVVTNPANKTLYLQPTGGACRIWGITVYYSDGYSYSDYMTYCTYIFTPSAATGNWSTTSNWSSRSVPTINDRATITKPVIVDVTDAQAKDIVLDQNGNTGSLTINANKGLEVAETIKVYDGSAFVATTESDLVLESSSAGNASLVFENDGNAATVQMYSKASIDGKTWNWQYVGTPFEGSIPLYNYYDSWMYKWDKENSGWTAVTGSETLIPFDGYCLTQESATTHVMGGTLVSTTEDIEVTMPENTDMVLANSWTAPISIASFDIEGGDATFTSTPATIYLFNTGMAEEGSSAGTEAGTYIAVPINSAPYTGNGLIAPMQGFFVTTNGVGGAAGTITMNYDALVRPSGSHTDIVAGPMKAPKRVQEDEHPAVLKISATGSEYSDRVIILEREDFSEGFDNGWDGKKLSFGVASPSIYVINGEDDYDAVSAIPDLEGTVVGFRAGEDSYYTMSFDYEGDENWYFNDLLEQKSTLITEENTYSFNASADDNEMRFVISKSPISKIPTGTGDMDSGPNVRKLIIHDKLFIIRSGRIYSADGCLVK